MKLNLLGDAELMEMGGEGSLPALREMTDRCARGAYIGMSSFEHSTYAEAFGRLAAAHGEEYDNIVLAGILWVRAAHLNALGAPDRGLRLLAQAEAICDRFPFLHCSEATAYLAAILTVFADNGNELAADRVNKLIGALDAPAADLIREAVRASELEDAANA
jgi:hypothetical protein